MAYIHIIITETQLHISVHVKKAAETLNGKNLLREQNLLITIKDVVIEMLECYKTTYRTISLWFRM